MGEEYGNGRWTEIDQADRTELLANIGKLYSHWNASAMRGSTRDVRTRPRASAAQASKICKFSDISLVFQAALFDEDWN